MPLIRRSTHHTTGSTHSAWASAATAETAASAANVRMCPTRAMTAGISHEPTM